ncbi:adenylosuccinate lyase family protein [Seohaeicola saemankumensis]|nr:lyase family protein [Seohaeicola saemankumensis]MCA0871814.1 adenylosuccinate lyase family protein [Seohaeicola saemankumensis]
MAGSVFDSPMYARLFPATEVGRLFTDSAEIRAMILVEGALAKAQGALGVIPEASAAAISRAAMEIQIDPGHLAEPTGQNGVCVPGLVAAFRTEMQAPEHAQYLHWGATSQDIIDTGLMLRLRQALAQMENGLRGVITPLAALAETHADLPMAARTFGQHATPTSFGAVTAAWGMPLITLTKELPALRADCLLVSLSGAAGTASALGRQAAETRARLAADLRLGDPGRGWHTDRTPILRIADWMTRTALALGKIGEDATAMVQSGIAELDLGGAGASSTMPQKQNPVAPSALVALARHTAGQTAILHGAAMPRHQRDGAAWFTEWMCLPQIVLGAGSALQVAGALCAAMTPKPKAMTAAFTGGLDMIHAEALSFALTAHMPRPEAQAAVKSACREVQETGTPLARIAARRWPDLDTATLFTPAAQMGQAPDEARAFAALARELAPT